MDALGIIGFALGVLFFIAILYMLSLAEKALKIYINKNKNP
jgi:mannitol-specific phosphotransferase system IIBC component